MWEEILLHEFIHELMEENRLRPKSWKWNEGLVTYMTHFSFGTHKKYFEEKPKATKSKMWNIYARHTYKWTLILKDISKPKERRKMMERKIKEVNKEKS